LNFLDILPIIHLAIESPTHTIVDSALRSLPIVLPVLDFSTIKNELFPVIASVFTKTSSLGIKVRGLEAFAILCGGSNDPATSNDGLDGIMNSTASKKSSSTALDKYTMQEKIVPLIRAIKTKEPAVAMASLNVLRQVGGVADADFVAMDILPVLWSMSLGPLLDLKQFQAFIELIKSLSTRVEAEQTKKLQELSGVNGSVQKSDDFMSFGAINAFSPRNGASDGGEVDFESLVKGNAGVGKSSNAMDGTWDSTSHAPAPSIQTQPAAFSWSTPSPTAATSMSAQLQPQQRGPPSRTITPDLSRFETLSPQATQFSQPLQPNSFNAPLQPTTNTWSQPSAVQPPSAFQSQATTVNWGAAAANPWANNSNSRPINSTAAMGNLGSSVSNLSMNEQRPSMSAQSSFSLPPPPGSSSYTPQQTGMSSFTSAPAFGVQQKSSFPPPPAFVAPQNNAFPTTFGSSTQTKPGQKTGLDAYESLI
jgi:SCY1-like protein 2